MSLNFGTPKPDGTGAGGAGDSKAEQGFRLTFDTPSSTPASAATTAGGFSTGGLTLTFGGAAMPPAASSASGTLLGSAAPATSATSLGLGSTTFTLGSRPSTTQILNLTGSGANAPPTFGLLGASKTTAATTSTTGLLLTHGVSATPAASATPTLAFGSKSTAATGFSLTSASSTTAPASIAPTLSFGTGTTVSSAFSFGGPAVTTTASAAPVPSTTSLSFSLGGAAKTSAPSSNILLSTPVSAVATLGSAIPATTASLTTSPNMTFGQLVDAINKWTVDLEEQGKLFSNQAKQLNAWDRILVSNGEKVLSLNSGIERVKQQQQQLDQELDFVLAQQKELEDLITPLERDLNDIPLTDVDRLQTYQLAENMDTQMKQMSEDLKEIIEQLNETNKNQENSNPITQIRRILNAHMDSLQWIDRQTSKITGHLDQISKMHDLHRKSHEHSLKKTYN